MTRKHIVLAVLGITSFVALTGFASARIHSMMPFGHDPAKVAKFITWKVNDTLDDLKATDAQRAKVLAVKDRLLAQGQRLHTQHDAAHQQIEQQWLGNQMNVQELRTLADQQLNDLRVFIYQGIDAMAEVHDTLTPAQRTQLLEEIRRAHGQP
jgi:periplasmic protein CpxP/Spy